MKQFSLTFLAYFLLLNVHGQSKLIKADAYLDVRSGTMVKPAK